MVPGVEMGLLPQLTALFLIGAPRRLDLLENGIAHIVHILERSIFIRSGLVLLLVVKV